MTATVLVVTRSDADRTDLVPVIDALEARRARVFCVDTDCFPTEVDVALHLDGTRRRAVIAAGGAELDLAEVSAVWIHKFQPGQQIPSHHGTWVREVSVEASRDLFTEVLERMDVLWLDPPDTILSAASKPRQLQLATTFGLHIPRTLVTSSPEHVRRFAKECGGKIITKMIYCRGRKLRGAEHWVFTNPVSRDDLADLDGLRVCPMIFQEEIAKQLEIRVCFVGERVFVGSADSSGLEGSRYDRRRDPRIVETIRPHVLPRDVERNLLALATSLGLNYGTADFLLTPEGRYVFLEINPMGGFMSLQKRLGLPISTAIAEFLVGEAAPRLSARRPSLRA